jgi:hypothetical protein
MEAEQYGVRVKEMRRGTGKVMTDCGSAQSGNSRGIPPLFNKYG